MEKKNFCTYRTFENTKLGKLVVCCLSHGLIKLFFYRRCPVWSSDWGNKTALIELFFQDIVASWTILVESIPIPFMSCKMKLIEKPRICSYVIELLTDMLIVVREMARVFYSAYKS